MNAADLNPKIWPRSADRNEFGEIVIAGNTSSKLREEFGTPLYVYDADEIYARAIEIRTAFAEQQLPCDVHYASKAFLSKAVAKIVSAAGLHLDVASGGELTIALAAGVKPEHIAFHGNNKSDSELELAISKGIGHIIADSPDEISRINRIARSHGVVQHIMIRATLGINAETHDFISTAHEDQKFGLSVTDGSLETAVELALSAKSVELIGLHSHIGSQVLVLPGFIAAARKLVQQTAILNEKYGLSISVLGLGGGFGIAYTDSDNPIGIAEIATALNETVISEAAANQVEITKITVEPGRYIVGPAGVSLYTVGTIKPVTLASGETRVYVAVDGGMSDNIRTALYDANYTAVLANRNSSATKVLSRVVGKHCESGDIVVRDTYLPSDLKPGDIIAVAATGAYCRSMSSQYNGTPRPAVVGISGDQPAIWLRRETYEDLLALDLG
ncbi:MAG: diaminopimelate decarboxylase [Candidatus Nanopelagicales bacterium]